MLGAIEAGGTKCVLAVGPAPGAIIARHVIATRDPDTTLAEAASWFEHQEKITALGIASFGPVDLDPQSATWGHIGKTPKPHWTARDIAGFFRHRLAVPVGLDTDVNGAALAEFYHGAGRGTGSLAYVTVGTGIGGGIIIDGRPVHGAAHPEMGHIFPRRRIDDRDFAGICPYHGDCLEGLASGPAIMARWRASLSDLPVDHIAHDIIADYLAQLAHSIFAMTACSTIVFGGGVAKTAGLIDRIAVRAAVIDAAYLPGGTRHRIVPPMLGDDAGIVGAMMLAEAAAEGRITADRGR
jgi:fructokinase